MLAEQPKTYTPEEYLVLEEQAEYKSEYRQGQIVAMTGASLNHNYIVSNVHATLYNLLEATSCRVFSNDLRLWIEKKRLYTYPDILVVCGQPEFIEGRNDTVVNPKVIIEVLSKSTRNYDRGEKFQTYWTLDSLAEYVLIDQYRLQVEYFRQVTEKEWVLRVLVKEDDILELESLQVAIPLNKIYRDVSP